MNIEKVSLAVQIDGIVGFVVLDQERLKLLVQMSSSLSDNGKVNVVRAPAGFEFMTLGDAT